MLGVALAELAAARALSGHPRQEVLATFQRALALQREIGDRSWEAVTRHNLGWYLHRQGESHQAERIFRETLAVFQEKGDHVSEAVALANLGGIDLDFGRLAEAEKLFTRARALFVEIGDPDKEAIALFGLARVRRAAGQPAAALTAIEAATFFPTTGREQTESGVRAEYVSQERDLNVNVQFRLR